MKIRKCTYTRNRDCAYKRYEMYNQERYEYYNYILEPTMFQLVHWENRSFYNLYIKNRVFDWNMVQGLCDGNFVNVYWEIHFKRKECPNWHRLTRKGYR